MCRSEPCNSTVFFNSSGSVISKSQIPNPKTQIPRNPKKSQEIPRPTHRRELGFGSWDLGFGIWDLLHGLPHDLVDRRDAFLHLSQAAAAQRDHSFVNGLTTQFQRR